MKKIAKKRRTNYNMATNIPLTGVFNVTCEYKRKNSEKLKENC